MLVRVRFILIRINLVFLGRSLLLVAPVTHRCFLRSGIFRHRFCFPFRRFFGDCFRHGAFRLDRLFVRDRGFTVRGITVILGWSLVRGFPLIESADAVEDRLSHSAGRIQQSLKRVSSPRAFKADFPIFSLLRGVVAVLFAGVLFIRFGLLNGLLIVKHDLIGKAQLNSLLGVQPGFIGHQLGDLVAGKPGLRLIGVHDALLDLVERGDGFLHRLRVPHGNGHRVVDHQHGHRGHHHTVTGHGDDGRGAGRNGVDLHGHVAGIIANHGVYLSGRKHVAAGTVDVDGDIPIFSIQVFPERLGGHTVRPEGFLVDGTFQPKDTAAAVIPDPTPELAHSGSSFLSIASFA